MSSETSVYAITGVPTDRFSVKVSPNISVRNHLYGIACTV